MPMARTRTLKKWLLGREIQWMINKAGMSQADAAKIIECSQSKIALLADGSGTIAVGDLELLARQLGFDNGEYIERLRELRRDAQKRGRWATGYNRAYAEDLRLFIEAEAAADRIRIAQAEVVPGLVQIESYARAQHSDGPDEGGGLTVDDLVAARLARQNILDSEDPPQLHIVMSESCLRRRWADRETMRHQIEHLINLSNRRKVLIQVVPFDVEHGRRSPVGHRFTMLHVPTPGMAGPLEFVYAEGVGDIRYIDQERAVVEHEEAWSLLQTIALNPGQTREFMQRVLHELS